MSERTPTFPGGRAVGIGQIGRKLLSTSVELAPIGIVLLVWELASGTVVNARILPPFSETAGEIVALGLSAELQTFALHTIFRGLAGAAIAMSIAIPVGFGMAKSDLIRRNMEPVISITYPSPKSPLIPLMIYWLGIGHTSRIVLAVISGLLPMLVSTYNGAKDVARELIWSARSMGVEEPEETLRVMFPAALPMIVTGVRIGIIFSFITVISSEMILARSGLGFLVMKFGRYGYYPKVFATAFWIVVVVGGIDRLFLSVSRYYLRWSDQEVGGI